MHILHYTLGFAPYRSGGLTRYAFDLMLSQRELEHEVVALYPSGTSLLKGKCHVQLDRLHKGIAVYEMVNPMPVPLMYGVKCVDDMMNETGIEENLFKDMLKDLKIDIMHVHTLMGLPLLYLKIAHEQGIKIVYTSHDYYGICAKVNFIDADGEVCNNACSEKCNACNRDARSTFFLRVRNLKCLVPLKSIVRRLK